MLLNSRCKGNLCDAGGCLTVKERIWYSQNNIAFHRKASNFCGKVRSAYMTKRGTLTRRLGAAFILAGTIALGTGMSAQAAAPARVTITSGTASESKITLKWNKVKKAASYKIYVKKGSGKTKLLSTRSADKSTAVKITKLKNNVNYTFYVSAVNSKGQEGKKSEGKVLTPKVKTPGPTINITLSDLTETSVTVSWSKASSATHYVVYRVQADGSYKRLARTKKTKVLLKGLQTGTEYKIVVRAQRVKGGAAAGGTLSKVVRFTPGSVASALAKVYNYSAYTSTGYNTEPTTVYPSNVVEAYANTKIPELEWYRGRYLIWLNVYTQHFYILKRTDTSEWNWKFVRVFICATGSEKATRYGWMTAQGAYNKPMYFNDSKTQIAYYPTLIDTGAIHSQLYYPNGTLWNPNDLGHAVSHGCIRLRMAAAKYVQKTIPRGTKIWMN